ncbi:hypothetical protein AB0F81_38025 [Actinoplanes sp. NPDC024001]|uniref:hypothetical protein n=1 Tax=Actinoplanes sp. NPDC024001 TaxID=3154598 RepID=UPI0033D2085E
MFFVCRWREDSPFSKRVVRVPDATVLDWFRRGWNQEDPEEWIENELGGDVYGLDSIFLKAGERNLPRPETVDELRALLHEYLWVEGDDKATNIRLGEHALRVRTDDDEVDLAYYFIDDEAVAAAPGRLAYLLHDTWPLPTDTGSLNAVFDHRVPVRIVRPVSPGSDSVFAVRLGWQHSGTGTNLDLQGALTFPGLSLPELAAHLAGVHDVDTGGWPRDARLLRSLVAPGETDIGRALQRYARLPGYDPAPSGLDTVAAHEAIHREVLALLLAEQPVKSLIHLEPHIAQVARYIDDFFGFDQWLLFDTGWAATHPDLARSLLRYAARWDPYEA